VKNVTDYLLLIFYNCHDGGKVKSPSYHVPNVVGIVKVKQRASMIRFMSLLILAGVLATMIQPFDVRQPIDVQLVGQNIAEVDTRLSQARTASLQKNTAQPAIRRVDNDLADRLNLVKINPLANRVIADAIIKANSPIAHAYPVDEAVYNQPGEIEQPLQAFNEQDMALTLAGLSTEQNQIIIDGIVAANLNKP
jgi:hypothetical protein